MRSLAVALGLALLLSMGAGSSSAWSQSVQIGPGGVRISPNDHHMRRRHHRWERGHRERCRTVVEHRRNRFGERVTRRTRVCRD